MHLIRQGFTIVELLTIIVVISILAGIAVIGYGPWQERTATTAVKADLGQAASSLEGHENFNDDFPPNLAGTGFIASNEVVLKLSTNAPQIRVYSGLTAAQNAQLFLNTCNANMPTTSLDGSITYNTSCTFSGNNIHISGTKGSNVTLQGPTVEESDIVLTCGSGCDAAALAIKQEFQSQGGTFPITVSGQQVSLPPSELTSYGSATKYCLEAVSVRVPTVVYHVVSAAPNTPVAGPCPVDPDLHYP